MTVVTATNQFRRQKWPSVDEWYVVSMTADGNPIGLDHEGVVWVSNHGIPERLAEDLDTYLSRVVS